VLCVDDDPHVSGLLTRLLSTTFDVVAANSAPTALGQISGGEPFAVVVSDFRMPGTDGVTLLGHVRELSPDTVRIILTGNGDLETAIAAVNRGQIFRFLEKPCTPDVLRTAVAAAADQYRLVTSERVLLEQTLHGSIKALVNVLALAQPQAFGRATRVRRHAAELAGRVGERDRWPIEIAAMLSQVGCTMLPQATVDRYLAGESLSEDEMKVVAELPATAERVIGGIPRLEAVREILRFQDTQYDGRAVDLPTTFGLSGDRIPRGARMLKIALDFDLLENQGSSVSNALTTMLNRDGWYDPALLAVFGDLRGAAKTGPSLEQMRLSQVRVGMVFGADLRMENGLLLVARGQEVGVSLMERIRHQWQSFAAKCVVSIVIQAST
jgi:response regulator RpfG family c-di-GMP phosphodiesterase